MGHYDLPSDSEVIERLREQVSSLASQRNGLESQLAEARAEIERLTNINREQCEKGNTYVIENARLTAELARSKDDCETLIHQRDDAQKKRGVAEAESVLRLKQFAEYADGVNDDIATLRTERAEIERLKQTVEYKDKGLFDLAVELTARGARIAELEADVVWISEKHVDFMHRSFGWNRGNPNGSFCRVFAKHDGTPADILRAVREARNGE